jgi:hypothetical protein
MPNPHLVFIHSDCKDKDIIINSFKNADIYEANENTDLSSLLVDVSDSDLSGYTHLALVYHNPGYPQIPLFVETQYPQDEEDYYSFSYELLNFVKRLVNSIPEDRSLIIDLLTCDLRYPISIREFSKLEEKYGINIRYSVDLTGNTPYGNWTMESDNTNVKDLYFNDNILNYTDVLNSARTISDIATKDGFDLVGSNTLILTDNIDWPPSGYSHSDYIRLNAGEIFDGKGYYIECETNECPGLVTIDPSVDAFSNAPIIKNLTISGGALSNTNNGTIIRNAQPFFKLLNCSNSRLLTGTGMGGFVGSYAANGGGSECLIQGCTVIIEEESATYEYIKGASSGGIFGQYIARNGGKATVKNCTIDISGPNTKIIEADWCGGIGGPNACRNDSNTTDGDGPVSTLEIIDCKVYGTVHGRSSGTGSYCSCILGRYSCIGKSSLDLSASTIIKRCDYSGNSTGNFNAGIIGTNSIVDNATLTIDSCKLYHNLDTRGCSHFGCFIGMDSIYSNSTVDISNTVGVYKTRTNNATPSIKTGAISRKSIYSNSVVNINNVALLGDISYQNANSSEHGGFVGEESVRNDSKVFIKNSYTTHILEGDRESGFIAEASITSGSYAIILNCYQSGGNNNGSKNSGKQAGFIYNPSTGTGITINSFSMHKEGNAKGDITGGSNTDANYDYTILSNANLETDASAALLNAESIFDDGEVVFSNEGNAYFSSSNSTYPMLSKFTLWPWRGYTSYDTVPTLNIIDTNEQGNELQELDESFTTEVINTVKTITVSNNDDEITETLVPENIADDDVVIRQARHNVLNIIFANNSEIRSFITAPSKLKLESLIQKGEVKTFNQNLDISINLVDICENQGFYVNLNVSGDRITVYNEELESFTVTQIDEDGTLFEVTGAASGTYSPGETLTVFNREFFFGGFGSDNREPVSGDNGPVTEANNNIVEPWNPGNYFGPTQNASIKEKGESERIDRKKESLITNMAESFGRFKKFSNYKDYLKYRKGLLRRN